MSSVHEVNLDEDDLVEAVQGSTTRAQTDIFDLKTLGEAQFEDLKTFKQMRTEKIAQRKQLDAQIKVLEKRIEMVLSNIKTLQTPA